MRYFFTLLYLLFSLLMSAFAKTKDEARLITIGGSITEIVYQLGMGDQIVGVDRTSLYPEAVKNLPSVGYWKNLSGEGIVALSPTLVLTWQDAQPANVLAHLKSLGIEVVLLDRTPSTPQEIAQEIRTISTLLGVNQKGEILAKSIEDRLEQIAMKIAKQPKKPKVLFLLNMTSGPMYVAGRHTIAGNLLTLAGGDTLATHSGYQIMSAESLLAVNPDIIVITSSVDELPKKLELLSKIPGIDTTTAWQHQRIIPLDKSLIASMGTRIADTVDDLYHAFYPDAN